ncbi:hypothetical protein [uncultured Tateyamaria sp.]|uniref:hypothetical protein n=1 Tax=Tateyamaria sp. 1078 TaxID=3417464 RepID=UPI00262E3675|nr:hypothetical protein [uncultured Tateyamaria sp.]
MPSDRPLSDMSPVTFRMHVKRLRARYGGPPDVIRQADFDDLDDLVDFFKHHDAAEDVQITAADMSAQLNAIARSTPAPKRMTNAMAARLALQKAEDRRKPKRTSPKPKPKSKPKAKATSKPTSKPASGGPRRTTPAPKFSDLVQPGLYLGADPFQQINSRPVGTEIDPNTPKFRRQRVGVGKCTGNKLKAVKRAYLNAYCLVEGARREVQAIARNPDARILWHASTRYPEASLAHWFGADYSPAQMNRMLTKIEAILSEWSLAFCAGFRGLLPVFIRCKSVGGVGDGTVARHLVKNTIELMPIYFNRSRNQQTVTLLHEMGHRSTALLKPRDERHDLCSGGWNRKENMCYRDRDDVDKNNKVFLIGNPRLLAEAAETGNTGARKTALNNIDNYVCYMWNRQRDHGLNQMYLLSPGAKAPPRPAGASKPAS